MAMTFSEAESRFWQIRGMRAAGQMDQVAFETALKGLMVQDAQGRWWMPHQETGQWHVHDGSSWVPGTPARSFPAQGRPTGGSGQAGAGVSAARTDGGGLSMGRALLFALALWSIVAVAVAVFVAPEGALGVGLAALISILLLLHTYQDNWEGVIERMETRRVRVDRGDDDPRWENQLFAVIRLTNGKTKDLRPTPSWQVGDHLIKRRGEAGIRKL